MKKHLFFALTIACLTGGTVFSEGTAPGQNPRQHSLESSELSAINACLDKASKLAEKLKDENTRQCVLAALDAAKKQILVNSLSGNKSASEIIELLHENLGEMLCEEPDSKLRVEIQRCIGETLKQLSQKEIGVRVRTGPPPTMQLGM